MVLPEIHFYKQIFEATIGAATSAPSEPAGNSLPPLPPSSCKHPQPPRRILPLDSTTQATSAILQNPQLFFSCRVENRIPRPPSVKKKKKPPPTGLAGYNGPPKECFPLHALSPPPMAEQRERDGGRQRGVTFLSALSPRWLPASLTASLFRSTS